MRAYWRSSTRSVGVVESGAGAGTCGADRRGGARFSIRVVLPALAVVLWGCDESASPSRAAASLSAESPISQGGTVGWEVLTIPVVRVRDAGGAPLQGVTVNWSLIAGNGSIGAPTSVSNGDGLATLSGWTLGTMAGENIVRATVQGVDPVFFQAVTTALPAQALVAHGWTAQSLLVGQEPVNLPAVRAVDVHGNAVQGIPVDFAVAVGGGMLAGASQVTDANGIARLGGWRTGATAGEHRVLATAPALPAVQFAVQAGLSPKCGMTVPHTLFTTSAGVLTDDDCLLPNEYYHDFFSVTIPSQQAIRILQKSGAIDPYLLVLDGNGDLVAEDNNSAGGVTLNAALTVIAPAGPLELVASSALTFELGPYNISTQSVSQSASGCEVMHAMRGVSTAQILAASDCIDPGGPFYFDRFKIRLRAGEPVTITMSSAALDSYLQLYIWDTHTLVAENDDMNEFTLNASITYTPTVSDYFTIYASSHFPEEVGSYTLSISPAAGALQGSTFHGALLRQGVLAARPAR